MFGDPYATVQDLEERLGRLDDGRFTALLDVASRAVEKFCRRQFNRDTGGAPVATARKFTALDPSRVPTDDFHTSTGLVINVDGTAWATSDVELRPWDGRVNGMEGWPFFDLISKTKAFPNKRYPVVTVAAHWGWSEVPEAIKQATIDVAEVVSSGNGGAVRAETMGTYSVTYAVPTNGTTPPELTKAVPYRRKVWGVA